MGYVRAGFIGLVVVGAAVSYGSAAGARCSVMPVQGIPDTVSTYLLGSATPDTVRTGPGAVEPAGGPGHWGPGGPRSIHGQVVRVERLGGAAVARVARAFQENGDRRVVIVPWDYDPACRPTVWSRSARWLPPGGAGVFRRLRLRPEADWAGGMPTFDAFHADIQPYPLGPFFRRGYRGTDALRTGPSLTAAQYFDLYHALPRRDQVRDDPEAAASTIDRWERAHPEAAAMYPAPEVLEHASVLIRSAIDRRQLDSVASPLAGTYRVTFALDAEGERTFYARTRARPTDRWSIRPRERAVDPRRRPPVPDGYVLLVSGAPSRASLPDDCRRNRVIDREGYIDVWDPHRSREGRNAWVGKIELRLLARQFPSDSVLAAFVRAELEQYMQWPRDQPLDTPARFRRRPDGTIRLEQTTTLPDGRSLEIRGERISAKTIACAW